ncbi:MAG: hypothetical protein ABW047_17810 [Nitrospiraceae bacterium]
MDHDVGQEDWERFRQWWIVMGDRLNVKDRMHSFFQVALGSDRALGRARHLGGQVDYILFVIVRYWIPVVLPPSGRERLSKNDPDYWLESQQILKAAVVRLRELRPLIELLTDPNPLADAPQSRTSPGTPVVEVELANMLEGIAEVAGSYGGPDYTSVIKRFDPVPLRQTQPFKHNKRNSAELWVVFLLREHFRSLALGKDRYWSLIAALCAAAGITQSNDQAYGPDELKSWWQKNWPRTYNQLEQTQSTPDVSGTAYHQDFEWFTVWIEWQRTQLPTART